LAERVGAEPALRLLAPVALNIACFAYVGADGKAAAAINRRIVEALHVEGRVAPSLTTIDGQPAIRACLINHRTTAADINALVDHVLAWGERFAEDGGEA
jgi:glutamate/tyrosine decarboxylase-like PLP-dependent enzyme